MSRFFPGMHPLSQDHVVRGRFNKSEARWEALKLWLQNNPDKVALVVTPDASFEVRLVKENR